MALTTPTVRQVELIGDRVLTENMAIGEIARELCDDAGETWAAATMQQRDAFESTARRIVRLLPDYNAETAQLAAAAGL